MEPQATFQGSTPSPVVLLGRYQGDLFDSDNATAQTIRIMVNEHIRPAAQDPAVRAAALWACEAFRGGPGYQGPVDSPEAMAYSLWWYAKHKLKFLYHEAAIRQLLGERDQLQLLISPSIIVRADAPEGDCAVYTLLLCALLKSLGLGYEIVTTASDPHRPHDFSHVFPRVVLPDGSRITLDASHGKYPGWEVPKAHQLRRQVWNEAGRAIADKVSRYDGLHNYIGLGADVTDLSGAFSEIPAASDPNAGYQLPVDSTPYWQAASAAAPASGPTLAQELAPLSNTALQLVSKVVAPTVSYTVGPNGQIQYTAPAGSAGAALPSSLSALGSGGLGTVLALAGVAIVLVLVLRKSRS